MGLRIIVGGDNAGYNYKEALKKDLEADERVDSVVDVGVTGTEDATYYPNVAIAAAEKIAAGEADRALLICGTGLGVAIAANKVKGVRAALAWSEQTAALGREHNDANVVAIGGRMHTVEESTKFVEIFLATPYSGEARHTRRIEMLSAYENTGELPPVPAHHPQQG